MQAPDEDVRDELAGRVAALAAEQGVRIAAAESLTGGLVAQPLAAAKGSGDWFRGALIAYASEVKHEVLDVPDGPVVSAESAVAMARGVRRLLRADVAVAVTGVGGPDEQEGCPPGTVFVAVDRDGTHQVRRLDLSGDPPEVCAGSAGEALRMLVEELSR